MDKRINQFLSRPVAHRGFHDLASGAPENTLAAFERAVQEGYPIECDLRLTKDNRVVVFHDDSLERLCGSSQLIEKCDYEELKNFKVQNTSESIPLLEELLELAGSRVPLLLELKVRKFSGELERRVRDLITLFQDTVALQSFHPVSVWWWNRNAPGFLRALVAGDLTGVKLPRWQRVMVENLAMLPLVKPHFISYQGTELTRPVLSIIDLPIFAWTAHSQKEGEGFLKNGASNIIFEGYRPH